MVKESNCDILFADLVEGDIGSILRVYDQANTLNKQIEEKLEMLRDKLKVALKERKWDSFTDDKSKVSVSLSMQQRESVNKKALKMLLNEEQYNQVITKTSFERLLIVNQKDRERLKQYGKK